MNCENPDCKKYIPLETIRYCVRKMKGSKDMSEEWYFCSWHCLMEGMTLEFTGLN